MAPQDSAGRISKDAFTVSISVLLAPAILGVILRLFIILRVKKQRPTVDDYLLIVALCFLLTSIVIIYTKVIDAMYLIWAVELGMTNVTIPANFMDIAYSYHLWNNICLLISWCSFSAVKLSFMFFFKKLIDRMRPWQIYWWIILAYTVCVLIYGSLVFFISCPYFYDPRENNCDSGKMKDRMIQESIALAVMDVVGDCFILAIPIMIIWKIQARWSQKVLLSLSLCLTVFMIILSIVRVSGLAYHGTVDSIWETYWQFLSAEVGVFLASAVSFRSLFTSQNKQRATPNYSIKRLVKDSFTPKRNLMSISDSWLTGTTEHENEMESLPKSIHISTDFTVDEAAVREMETQTNHSNTQDLEAGFSIHQTQFIARPDPATFRGSHHNVNTL